MSQAMQGTIRKATAGFYYIYQQDKWIECRARGNFRARGVSPLVGDRVEYTVNGNKGMIEKILPRKNSFIRPPMANLDQLFIVVSTVEPAPNYFVIDKLTSIVQYKQVQCTIVVTKWDLLENHQLVDIYQKAGFGVIVANKNVCPDYKEQIGKLANKKISAFIGNSGVGKSTLLNKLDMKVVRETNAISNKLGRGKHTTRVVELFAIGEDTYLADTPGFSDVDLHKTEGILKDDLADTFIEFLPYQNQCRFHDCHHVGEPGCRIFEAVEEGSISQSRYDSYRMLYQHIKDLRPWQL